MARDYKPSRSSKHAKSDSGRSKKPQATPNKNKRSNATKNTPKAEVVGNKPPKSLWLAAIASTLLLMAGLYFLARFVPKSDKSYQQQNPEIETKFDFFTTMPEMKVTVDTPELDQAQIRYEYLLQAGSFKHEADAEARRAELGFMGQSSQIIPVTVNGSNWYRVQIGPLSSRSQVSEIRTKLFENGIETLVFKHELTSQTQP